MPVVVRRFSERIGTLWSFEPGVALRRQHEAKLVTGKTTKPLYRIGSSTDRMLKPEASRRDSDYNMHERDGVQYSDFCIPPLPGRCNI